MRVFQLSKGTDACDGCKLSEIFFSMLPACKTNHENDVHMKYEQAEMQKHKRSKRTN